MGYFCFKLTIDLGGNESDEADLVAGFIGRQKDFVLYPVK
jgi:hypothetical protein